MISVGGVRCTAPVRLTTSGLSKSQGHTAMGE